MDALDGLRETWHMQHDDRKHYDTKNMSLLIRKRMKQHTREPMKYFWASFALQMLVYGLYAHVIIVRFHNDPFAVGFALVGILIYVPFTFMLMRKFKQMAILKPDGNEIYSVHDYVMKHRDMLQHFFRFKVRYELFLIPLSTLCGTLLVFMIYVPGGPLTYPGGVLITMAIALVSCYMAIRNENRKAFRTPLAELEKLISEFAERQD
jgi:hypothetical protein